MTEKTAATGGLVYGVRLRTEYEYRYVGITTKTASRRFHQHLCVAASGRKTPFYDWLRKFDPSEVAVDVLELVEGLPELGQAEVEWISYLRSEGNRLLNLSEGGLGPTGVVWTDAMREAARIRSTGRKIVRESGPGSPFYGKHHSVEQKQKWSRERKGSYAGPENPNFGKFGPEHPGFGHKMSDDSRRLLSESRMGPLNPNFGKTASVETRAKRSAATKGIPRPASKRNAHTRHHTNKNVVKIDCDYCMEDAAEQKFREESD